MYLLFGFVPMLRCSVGLSVHRRHTWFYPKGCLWNSCYIRELLSMPSVSTALSPLQEACALQYYFLILWRILGILPPSKTYMNQLAMNSPEMSECDILHTLRWSSRLRIGSYVNWIKVPQGSSACCEGASQMTCFALRGLLKLMKALGFPGCFPKHSFLLSK